MTNLNFYLFVLTILNVNCFSIKDYFTSIKRDPDEFISTSMLILNKGYPVQEHNVITEDGYILKIHRIPYGRERNNVFNKSRPVVLLQHGLLDCSATFVINFPDQSLGFILADNGYDVWIGNMRGNTYGLNHVTLNPDTDEFWDFSWDEMANFDLPSMVNYILKTTGERQLIYVGHSQGTMIAFSGLSKNKDLDSKIKLFIALGPVAQLNHMKSPIRFLADLGIPTNQQIWYTIFGKRDFMPSTKLLEWLADRLCNIEAADKYLCENIIFVLTGPSSNINITRVPVYTTHEPAGTSVKNLIHFSQMAVNGKFQMYDFGNEFLNRKHYNQTKPPIYNINNVKTPVALYWAPNDWLADPIDIEYLRSNLPNIVDDYEVVSWNHVDFLWATNTKTLLYDRMISLMKKFV